MIVTCLRKGNTLARDDRTTSALRRRTAPFGYRWIPELLHAIARHWDSTPPTIVLATTGPSHDVFNGYSRRVATIDRLLSAAPRIYVHCASSPQPTACRREGKSLWLISTSEDDAVIRALLLALVSNGANIYIHSVFAYHGKLAQLLLSRRTGKCAFDVHGAVPEELVLQGDDNTSEAMSKREATLVSSADLVVCVSHAMADHLSAKYNDAVSPIIIIPIDGLDHDEEIGRRGYNDRPCIIYSGGTDVWQQAPQMMNLIRDTHENFDFVLLTPSPNQFLDGLVRRRVYPSAPRLVLRSAGSAEISRFYFTSDFGLLLRENLLVNRVACPTKLVEYLRFGVIPVLDSPSVGDFAALGMAYVALEDLRSGRIPSIQRRLEMALDNVKVIRMLQSQGKNAARLLLSAFWPRHPSAGVELETRPA